MLETIRKRMAGFMALCMLFGIFLITDQPIDALEGSLQNTSVISSNKVSVGDSISVDCSATGGKGNYTYAVFYKSLIQNGLPNRISRPMLMRKSS